MLRTPCPPRVRLHCASEGEGSPPPRPAMRPSPASAAPSTPRQAGRRYRHGHGHGHGLTWWRVREAPQRALQHRQAQAPQVRVERVRVTLQSTASASRHALMRSISEVVVVVGGAHLHVSCLAAAVGADGPARFTLRFKRRAHGASSVTAPNWVKSCPQICLLPWPSHPPCPHPRLLPPPRNLPRPLTLMRSGDMYVTVPTHDRQFETLEASWPLTPKSLILTSPAPLRSRLEGLMSRWTT